MDYKPYLKNMYVHMSGECSICGDLLLTPPKSIRAHDGQSVDAAVQRMIANHVAQKHGDRLRQVAAVKSAVTPRINACGVAATSTDVASPLPSARDAEL